MEKVPVSMAPERPFRSAVDVHHHAVPAFYRQALADAGLVQSVDGVDFPAWDAAASLATMDELGVDTAVLSVSVPGVSTRLPLAVDLARRVNDFFAETIAARPGRFGAFATLPLPHVEQALEELRHALDELALDGIGLFTNYDGVYVADPAFEPVLAELDRRGATVFLHPNVPPAAGQPDFGLPASLIEFLFDTTRAVTQMLYARTFERFPNIRFIFAHAGGTVPYIAERLTFGPEIAAPLAERISADPLGDLRRQHYDLAMSASPFSLPALRALLEPSQLLFGSDFPFQTREAAVRNGAGLLRHGGFTQAEVAAVTAGNARRLLAGGQPALTFATPSGRTA